MTRLQELREGKLIKPAKKEKTPDSQQVELKRGADSCLRQAKMHLDAGDAVGAAWLAGKAMTHGDSRKDAEAIYDAARTYVAQQNADDTSFCKHLEAELAAKTAALAALQTHSQDLAVAHSVELRKVQPAPVTKT